MTKSTVEKAEEYPKLKELVDFLKKNYWEEYASLCDSNLVVVRNSRLDRVPLHVVYSAIGHDPNKLAEDALTWVRERLELERNENVNYCNKLRQRVGELFTADVGVYVKDRKENSSIPGRRFKITVELKANSNEHKRCGAWMFAGGYGRDENQAAKAALEMLELKEGNDLLWLNEWYNYDQPDGTEISFFDEKQLNSVKKQMLKRNTQVPNCRKDEEPIRLELKKSESSLSIKNLLRASPLATPSRNSDLSSATRSSSSLLSRLRRSSNNSSQNSSGSITPDKKSIKDTSTTDHLGGKGSNRNKTADKAGKKAETGQRPSTGSASKPSRRRAPSPYPGRGGGSTTASRNGNP